MRYMVYLRLWCDLSFRDDTRLKFALAGFELSKAQTFTLYAVESRQVIQLPSPALGPLRRLPSSQLFGPIVASGGSLVVRDEANEFENLTLELIDLNVVELACNFSFP